MVRYDGFRNRPPAIARIELEGPSRSLQELRADRKPDAGPVYLSREEWIEYPLPVLIPDAAATVLHIDMEEAVALGRDLRMKGNHHPARAVIVNDQVMHPQNVRTGHDNGTDLVYELFFRRLP